MDAMLAPEASWIMGLSYVVRVLVYPALLGLAVWGFYRSGRLAWLFLMGCGLCLSVAELVTIGFQEFAGHFSSAQNTALLEAAAAVDIVARLLLLAGFFFFVSEGVRPEEADERDILRDE